VLVALALGGCGGDDPPAAGELAAAAGQGDLGAVKELLRRGGDPDDREPGGRTAVILGDGGRAHQEIVRLLLDAGARRDLADRDGVTPLEHARRAGYSELEALLSGGED
jgi:ankyrin repeat protein